ncbi:MAG: M48 family metalloprotease [Pseudomonadota bacterium]
MFKNYTALCLVLTFLCCGLFTPAHAQVIIRDTEIEAYMQEWFAPIYEAAGKDASQVDIIMIQNNDVNAFVAGGANIFFYTGLLQKTDNPGEVIAVMAHELGHIEGGHLIRGREAMENASYESIIGAILGLGAALATGDGGAAATIGTGSSSMAQRRFLSEFRKYESGADQAAMRYMTQAGINPSGMLTFMQKLEDQELLPASQQSEYIRTHPLTRDRVNAIEARVNQTELKDKPLPAEWVDQHTRMKAKLLGFIQPQQVEWTYDVRDKSLEAVYARAIADYRQNRIPEALRNIDDLIAREPSNPYFHELKGQMLVDFGRLEEAKPYYERALELEPNAALFSIALAHAQIETAGTNKDALDAALKNLKRAELSEKRSSRLHRLMATAYGRLGRDPEAKLHLAEEAVLQRRYAYAKQQAEAAASRLKEGSADWLRAHDILNYVEQQKG